VHGADDFLCADRMTLRTARRARRACSNVRTERPREKEASGGRGGRRKRWRVRLRGYRWNSVSRALASARDITLRPGRRGRMRYAVTRNRKRIATSRARCTARARPPESGETLSKSPVFARPGRSCCVRASAASALTATLVLAVRRVSAAAQTKSRGARTISPLIDALPR
jgi:hypothetical protein